MCNLSWPTKVGLASFTEMANDRGWTDVEIAKAWNRACRAEYAMKQAEYLARQEAEQATVSRDGISV